MALQPGNCWKCGKDLTVLDYGRQDVCAGCGKDTRVCKNCVHFDPTAHNQCRESQAERVVEKERSNFCDYFQPKKGTGVGGATKDALRAAADALFKKK